MFLLLLFLPYPSQSLMKSGHIKPAAAEARLREMEESQSLMKSGHIKPRRAALRPRWPQEVAIPYEVRSYQTP